MLKIFCLNRHAICNFRRFDSNIPTMEKQFGPVLALFIMLAGLTGMTAQDSPRYDSFRTVYDRNTKTWSKPENMGFQINSPYDDYLFITDEFNRSADTVELPVEKTLPAVNDYNKVLAEALLLQLKADSLSRIVRDKRILARETPDAELKKQHLSEIILADKEAKACQREADQKFAEARNLRISNPVAPERTDSIITLSDEINGIRVYQYRTDEFTILEKSPYSESNPIPLGLGEHSGLVYRIQMGVFSKIRANDAFGGVTPIRCEQVNGNNVYKYYAGLFYSTNTVTGALEKVRTYGFPDAFVVAFHNGRIISTEKAREIEYAGFKL
jgi:hypothetical protein